MDNALKTGYSVAWDGDVSESGFQFSKGKATLSEEEIAEIKKTGIQDFRQKTFNSFSSTDDHLMHLTGIAENKKGEIYYVTKNSWGVTRSDYEGYLYMSKPYVEIKTVAIMVHKDAVPKEIAKKLKLQ